MNATESQEAGWEHTQNEYRWGEEEQGWRAETWKDSEVRQQQLDEYTKETKKEQEVKNEDQEMMIFQKLSEERLLRIEMDNWSSTAHR